MPELFDRREDDLKDISRQELKEILGLDAEPQFAFAFRWRHGLPQYVTGHLDRAAAIDGHLKQWPGLYVIGNSLYGLGVPDCIRSAKQAVEKIVSA
jgi:oxygen-dependent protoporphyrinogen oxidase